MQETDGVGSSHVSSAIINVNTSQEMQRYSKTKNIRPFPKYILRCPVSFLARLFWRGCGWLASAIIDV